MRVLVIGGTAFIGPHVVRQLAEQGHDVLVFHRGKTEADLPGSVRHARSPLANIPVLQFPDEVRQFAPDVVLHMMLMGEPDAQAVMDAFTSVAQRIVGVSSCDVYRAFARLRGEPGSLEPVPLGEDAPLRDQLYPYRGAEARPADDPQRFMDDYDKILAERVLMSVPQLPPTILRLPMVYGPHDKQHRLFPYIKRMADRRPAVLLDERGARWRNTRGYVENIAAAITLAVTDERATGRIYNVAEQTARTEHAWVQQIAQALGWSGDVVALPEADLPPHLQVGFNPQQHLVIDSTRIRHELGYAEIVPVDEAVQRTVAWERAHPPLQIDPADYNYAAEDAALHAASHRT